MNAQTPHTVSEGLHADWRAVRDLVKAGATWPWPHFTPQELSCSCKGRHCAGEYFHSKETLDALERLRGFMGAPLVVNSARRCPARNAEVGGAPRSQHMLAVAIDIAIGDHDPKALARNAARAGFRGIGFGGTFVHVDMRPTRTGFYYGNAPYWTRLFGFDPAVRFQAKGAI